MADHPYCPLRTGGLGYIRVTPLWRADPHPLFALSCNIVCRREAGEQLLIGGTIWHQPWQMCMCAPVAIGQ
jgi:hypothetical protein